MYSFRCSSGRLAFGSARCFCGSARLARDAGSARLAVFSARLAYGSAREFCGSAQLARDGGSARPNEPSRTRSLEALLRRQQELPFHSCARFRWRGSSVVWRHGSQTGGGATFLILMVRGPGGAGAVSGASTSSKGKPHACWVTTRANPNLPRVGSVFKG